MTDLIKTLVHALKEADDYLPHNAPVRAKVTQALAAYRESEEYKRERIDEIVRSANIAANKLDSDLQELLREVSLLTDSEEILLRKARELIAEAADYIHQIIDPEA